MNIFKSVDQHPKLNTQKINILRGIAIICVYFFHVVPYFITEDDLEYNRFGFLKLHSLKDVFLTFSPSTFGGSGVTLFLILSGFLIHYGFLSNRYEFNFKTFTVKDFGEFIHRIL